MKNVIAKFNAAGVKTFYVDDKRVSRAQAAEVYQNAAAHKFFSQVGDAISCSCDGAFVVEIHGLHEEPVINGAEFGREGMEVWLEFKFCSGADSVLNALKLAAIAVAIPDVTLAKIYPSDSYDWRRHVCGDDAGIIVRSDKAWITRTWGRVYQAYLDELAAQNFQPVIACNAAREKSQALTAELEELKKRKHAAWREEMDAQNARDFATEAYLQSFIA